MPPADRLALAWCVAVLAAALLFTAAPGIDLWVSSLFYRPGAGFPIASLPLAEWVRNRIWNASTILVVVSIAGLILSRATGGPALWLPGRLWGFVLALYALGQGVVVDGLLKAHWGRARPANVVEFGGTAHFTPALLPTDQCASNCSFVSGEGAATVALAICLWLILRRLSPRPTPRAARLRGAGLLVLVLTGAGLRVLGGRHFLSDIVFAALIMIGLSLLLHRLILARNPPDPLLTTPATPPIAPHTAGNPLGSRRLND